MRKASSSVISSTFSTNSSFERRRATTRSQARISARADDHHHEQRERRLGERQRHRDAERVGRLRRAPGISTSSGTTARSWNSSTPITSRPCGAVELAALGEQLRDDRGRGHGERCRRARAPACQAPPAASDAATTSASGGARPARGRGRTPRGASAISLRQAELQADREHQEHHAELGERVRSPRGPATRPSACGPSARPVSQVADHRRQAQAAAQHHRRARRWRAESAPTAGTSCGCESMGYTRRQ